MSTIGISGIGADNNLMEIINTQCIQPGDEPSYQACKTIFEYHPPGAKIAQTPIMMAQSQPRIITIDNDPSDKIRKRFEEQWDEDEADKWIFNDHVLARVYGAAALCVLVKGEDPSKELDLKKLAKGEISFNVFDPLNVSGSLMLSQMPNDMTFMKTTNVSVQGQVYHASRCAIVLNEMPIYISYTTSAFGWVGRSVYQRILYPLKTYIQSMITDDMIVRKAGVIVAKVKPPGSIIDNAMAAIFGQKREIIKGASTDNVISITNEEDIESLDLNNLEKPYELALKNLLIKIATGADMPAKLLNEETFAEGFGEGTEDAKRIAQYVARIRKTLDQTYRWMDRIIQYRAWNEDFYKSIQKEFPDQYGGKPYERAFYEWCDSFVAGWPNAIEEPASEKAKEKKVLLEAIVEVLETLRTDLDPENKTQLIMWAVDNLNELIEFFPNPMAIDAEALEEFISSQPPPGSELNADGSDKATTAPKTTAAKDKIRALR